MCFLGYQVEPFVIDSCVEHCLDSLTSISNWDGSYLRKSEHFLALYLRGAFMELSCQVYNFFNQKFSPSVDPSFTSDHVFFTIRLVIISLAEPRPQSVSDHQLHCRSRVYLTHPHYWMNLVSISWQYHKLPQDPHLHLYSFHRKHILIVLSFLLPQVDPISYWNHLVFPYFSPDFLVRLAVWSVFRYSLSFRRLQYDSAGCFWYHYRDRSSRGFSTTTAR